MTSVKKHDTMKMTIAKRREEITRFYKFLESNKGLQQLPKHTQLFQAYKQGFISLEYLQQRHKQTYNKIIRERGTA